MQQSINATHTHTHNATPPTDNFYPHGLNSTYDDNFDASFVKVYAATPLQVPWYAVLGNHGARMRLRPFPFVCAGGMLALSVPTLALVPN